jgi:hypothetical protein
MRAGGLETVQDLPIGRTFRFAPPEGDARIRERAEEGSGEGRLAVGCPQPQEWRWVACRAACMLCQPWLLLAEGERRTCAACDEFWCHCHL